MHVGQLKNWNFCLQSYRVNQKNFSLFRDLLATDNDVDFAIRERRMNYFNRVASVCLGGHFRRCVLAPRNLWDWMPIARGTSIAKHLDATRHRTAVQNDKRQVIRMRYSYALLYRQSRFMHFRQVPALVHRGLASNASFRSKSICNTFCLWWIRCKWCCCGGSWYFLSESTYFFAKGEQVSW